MAVTQCACNPQPTGRHTRGPVCRWRKLEGSDPTTYELIHKVQALQKRLLALLEAVAAKDAALADKQALCGQLKGMLDRRPGPEVAHQLIVSKVGVA